MIPANPWLDVAAVITAVLGVGRLTRVITYEDYPPSVWFRTWWQGITKYGGWSKLATCLWCASPYIAAICVVWGVFTLNTGWAWTWWGFWGTLSIAYLSAMVLVRDEPPER